MPTQESEASDARENQWQSVEVRDIAPGMHVRGTLKNGQGDEFWPRVCEGTVNRASGITVRFIEEPRTWSTYLRTWEQRVGAPAPSEVTWVPVETDAMAAGDYVRGTSRTGEAVEGVVARVTDMGNVYLEGGPGRYSSHRTWQKRVPLEAPAQTEPTAVAPGGGGTVDGDVWVAAELSDLAVGDRVRVTHRRRADEVHVGNVHSFDGSGVNVTHNGAHAFNGGEWFSPDYRTFEKWVTSEQPPTTTLAAPRVGNRFTRTFNTPTTANPARREGCTVTAVRPVGDAPGQTLWVIDYRDADGRVWDRGLLVRPDGTCAPENDDGDERDLTGTYEPEAAPTGVFTRPQVGDTFNRYYDTGERAGNPRMGNVVTRVRDRDDHWDVSYDHSGEPCTAHLYPDGRATTTMGSVPGRWEPVVTPAELASRPNPFAPIPAGTVVADPEWVPIERTLIREGMYVRGVSTDGWSATNVEGHVTQLRGDNEVDIGGCGVVYLDRRNWEHKTTGSAVVDPAPASDLPDWAVGMTLEQARKRIHDEARRLYGNSSNCYSGTRDFLSAAGLPSDPNVEYPTPTPVDESELVRAFLAKVRTDALTTASDHGKSVREVEGYLRRIGINPPRPMHEDHTVSIRVPAGANINQVLRDLGWEVR